MNIIGRWAQVRGYSGFGWDPLPAMLDRRLGKLSPFRHEDELGAWHRTRAGVWLPVIAGGSVSMFTQYGQRKNMGLAANSAAISTTAFSNAYTFNSAGNAFCVRIPRIYNTKTLAAAYVFQSGAVTGSPVVTCQVRYGTSATNIVTGATLVNSYTVSPTASKWWKLAPTDALSTTAGRWYWLAFGDTAGSGSRTATIMNQAAINLSSSNPYDAGTMLAGYTTTDGFATVRTGFSGKNGVVVVFSDGTAFGVPISANAAATSDTNQKGWYLDTTYWQTGVKCYGAASNQTIDSASTCKCWEGSSSGPNGSTNDLLNGVTQEIMVTTGGAAAAVTWAPIRLRPRLVYRLVFAPSGSTGTPNKWQIGSVDAGGTINDLWAALEGGGGMYYANATGPNTSWSDDTTAFPQGSILLDDLSIDGPLVGGGKLVG